jgi:hypothetical protein
MKYWIIWYFPIKPVAPATPTEQFGARVDLKGVPSLFSLLDSCIWHAADHDLAAEVLIVENRMRGCGTSRPLLVTVIPKADRYDSRIMSSTDWRLSFVLYIHIRNMICTVGKKRYSVVGVSWWFLLCVVQTFALRNIAFSYSSDVCESEKEKRLNFLQLFWLAEMIWKIQGTYQ